MDEEQIKATEIRGYRDLASEYLEAASDSLKSGHPRLRLMQAIMLLNFVSRAYYFSRSMNCPVLMVG